MNEGGNNGRQSDESLLQRELTSHCQSESLSEQSLLQIIDRHGLTLNNHHFSDYFFFLDVCENERVTEGIIRCLLDSFPEAATATDWNGMTPLHCACDNPNVTPDIIKVLINAAPDSVRSITNFGRMPLLHLCSNSKVDEAAAIEILKLLIEKCPEAAQHHDDSYGGVPPVHTASRWRSPDFCRVLIEAYPGSEQIANAEGELPFYVACEKNTIDTVEYLYGIYPDAIDRANTWEYRPTHSAMVGMLHRENPAAAVEILQFLLDCDPNQKLKKVEGGKSLLQYAYELGNTHIEAVIQMIKIIYDAHPEAIEDDWFAREIRVYHPRRQQVRAFIRGEIVYAHQPNDHRLMTTPDDNGQLPLHSALQNNVRLGSIKLLVKGNPSALQFPDNSGALPLHIACQHHDSASIVSYLVGLDPSTLDAVDREGNTALHYACRGAKYDTIALLLEKYDAASVSKTNAQGKLPVDLLWDSNEVEDRESLEYTESVFRLLKAYPAMFGQVGQWGN